MTPTERTGERRVALYVRDRLPKPAASLRDRTAEWLADMEASGAIASYAVYSWERRIRSGETDSPTRKRYDQFVAWADEHGVDLHPFFSTRECYSMDTGERGEWIVLPALCLAVYEGGDLVSVFPHADGDTYRSVADGLDALAVRRVSSTGDADDNVPVNPAD